mmetsp:Transcript_91378/g.195954  ORF Transcript_91378/g.195954 Transcript_91378/m.195954 type:complete len:220 (+) Transcript_91378:92-751(+)
MPGCAFCQLLHGNPLGFLDGSCLCRHHLSSAHGQSETLNLRDHSSDVAPEDPTAFLHLVLVGVHPPLPEVEKPAQHVGALREADQVGLLEGQALRVCLWRGVSQKQLLLLIVRQEGHQELRFQFQVPPLRFRHAHELEFQPSLALERVQVFVGNLVNLAEVILLLRMLFGIVREHPEPRFRSQAFLGDGWLAADLGRGAVLLYLALITCHRQLHSTLVN